MFDCILLIAGRGTRTKLDYNKAFYEFNKKPLYIIALEEFLKSRHLNQIIVVASPDEINYVNKQLKNYSKDKIVVIPGGKMRQDSVYEGVKVATAEYVLIHDGARPFITLDDIEKVYLSGITNQAAVLGIKLAYSIKEVKNEYIEKTLPRENVYVMQTPQAIKTSLFRECLNRAKENNYYGTDDVELVEKFSDVKVRVVIGREENIKITTQYDLKILSLLEGERND